MIFSMLFVAINNAFSYSQKIVLPQSYHIQNNSIDVIPPLSGVPKKTYDSKYESNSVGPYSSKSPQVNNTPSFTITNAAVTIMEKSINGITKVESHAPNQTVVMTEEKTITGKR